MTLDQFVVLAYFSGALLMLLAPLIDDPDGEIPRLLRRWQGRWRPRRMLARERIVRRLHGGRGG